MTLDSYLSPGHRLTSGARESIESLSAAIYNFIFNYLDADIGGEAASKVAHRVASAAARRLVKANEFYCH